DGQRLAVADAGGTLTLWDVAHGQEVLRFQVPPLRQPDHRRRMHGRGGTFGWAGRGPHPLPEIAFRADGRRLAAACEAGTIRLGNGSPVPERVVLKGLYGGTGTWAAVDAAGSVVSRAEDGAVRIQERGTGQVLATLRGEDGSAPVVALHLDSGRLAQAV